jgi:hypothetical protein
MVSKFNILMINAKNHSPGVLRKKMGENVRYFLVSKSGNFYFINAHKKKQF